MDNPGNGGINNPNQEEPISIEEDLTIRFDDSEKTRISHSPLELKSQGRREAGIKAKEAITSSERITGVKTFFTKLHAGAITFLEEQINSWLKDNPGVVIKDTNAVTGMLIGKKTEPNIIITIWY
jgi:hypothetical protein